MPQIEIISVNVGQPQIIGKRKGRDVWSSIVKWPVREPLLLTPTGLAGDQQTDTSIKPDGDQLHGGPLKALYAYPQEHFSFWEEFLGYDLVPGQIGENLTIRGLLETDARVGDVWEWGEAVLQVESVRQPCFKLDLIHGKTQMMKQMCLNGFCGWYLKVLQPGIVPVSGVINYESSDGETVAEKFRRKVPLPA